MYGNIYEADSYVLESCCCQNEVSPFNILLTHLLLVKMYEVWRIEQVDIALWLIPAWLTLNYRWPWHDANFYSSGNPFMTSNDKLNTRLHSGTLDRLPGMSDSCGMSRHTHHNICILLYGVRCYRLWNVREIKSRDESPLSGTDSLLLWLYFYF